MNPPYTPFEKAVRIANWAMLTLLASFLLLLLILVWDEADYMGFSILGSIVFAIVALLFSIFSLLLRANTKGWLVFTIALLILCSYGALIYLMRDFCVIC